MSNLKQAAAEIEAKIAELRAKPKVKRCVEGYSEPAKRRRPGDPPKEWNPDFAAKIPWYPKSPEAFQAWVSKKRERMLTLMAQGKRPTTQGVIKPFWGRKPLLLALRDRAKIEAKQVVAYMKKKEMIVEDPRAEEALEAMIGIVRAHDEELRVPLYKASDRIAAAKVVLDFTKQKPATKTDMTVAKAEDFLAAVVEDMKAEESSE